ncbi:hypothetical protein KKE60_02600 [Patescibacteria group bacterium]|nr:hypothetical protein [Patescibacteria group bacterium]MBU1066662.1 hypothetical protein [Patescibacteria group bacterium]MBU1845076.1 hypothetical protein [Patescibacteria group bacterium]
MASLTQTAIMTRKIIRYGLYGVIALIIGKIALSTSISVYRHFFPEPPPPPTVAFGKLPKIPFPKKEVAGNPSYTLETPEGSIPVLSTQAKVYFMPKPVQTQLNLELAKDKATNLGFIPSGEQVSQTLYRFKHQRAPSTLDMNIINGIFSISYDLSKDSSPIEQRPPSPEIAASQIRSYLSSANLLPVDLTGPTTHQFLKIEEGSFANAVSLSEADLVKVYLFRKSYDNFPSLTPNPSQANTWFMVSGSREREKQIIASEFHYFPVDEDKSATYPIKLAESAWEELKAGNAFIASQGVDNESNIVIRRVYLAYYDGGVSAEFYQPIIVFEGDRGFSAYVPAVTSDYYGE